MQNKNRLDDLRRLYLHKVYELTNGNSKEGVSWKDLASELGISKEEENKTYYYLKDKGLVKSIFQGQVSITTQGIDEVEKNMERTYAEKELLVLKTIYEMGKNSPGNEVFFNDLKKAVNMPYDDLVTIITELYDGKRYLGESSDETVKISPEGMEFLENSRNSHNQNSSATNIVNTFYGSVTNLQQQTHYSNQTFNRSISTVNNSDFNSAIGSILEIIKSSSLNNFKKEDLISDLERIQQLAEAENEPSRELVEHAKSKISYLETAIKATDLATKILPYFPQLYAYFEGLIK